MKKPPIFCDRTFNKSVPDTGERQSFRLPNPLLSHRSISLRSMAVLSSRAQERRSREIRPQSPRGFSALARLYYLARPTKTAMLRRLNRDKLRPFGPLARAALTLRYL